MNVVSRVKRCVCMCKYVYICGTLIVREPQAYLGCGGARARFVSLSRGGVAVVGQWRAGFLRDRSASVCALRANARKQTASEHMSVFACGCVVYAGQVLRRAVCERFATKLAHKRVRSRKICLACVWKF